MALGSKVSFAARSTRICMFPVFSVLVGVLALGALPQGTEILRTVSDDGLRHPNAQPEDFTLVVAFVAALTLWSLSNWFAARLLQRWLQAGAANARAPLTPPDTPPFNDHWIIWFPRLLIPAGILPLAAASAGQGQTWVALISVAVAVLLFSLVAMRRKLMRMAGFSPYADSPVTSNASGLSEGAKLALWLGASLALALFGALTLANYSVSRWLGGAAILLLALAAIGLFGSMVLVYLPRSQGWPAMIGTAIVISLILGTLRVTANHGIAARRADAVEQARIVRPAASEQLAHWLEDPLRSAPDQQAAPIVLVAAEGGASRSAWWTARVLGVLDEMTNGRFGNRVFAASGISGGSLGLATWVALRRDRIDSGPFGAQSVPGSSTTHPEPGTCERHDLARQAPTVKAACFLGRDFLSPLLGYMLGSDLVQRVVPVPVSGWDRSRGLEETWARDWRALFGSDAGQSDAFGQPLLDVYRHGAKAAAHPTTPWAMRTDIPVLLLNTATVARGRPAVQSPVRLPDAEIDDLLEPRFRTAGLTLAGAVHNSARFAYVSPAGDVLTADGQHFDSVVDGGYIENSGALALAALVRNLKAACDAEPEAGARRCVWKDLRARLHVLFIASDPAEPVRSAYELCDSAPARAAVGSAQPYGESIAPLVGLYRARSSRADSARRALVRDLGLCGDDPGDAKDSNAQRAYFVSMASPTIQEDQTVMSWYITPASRKLMWQATSADPARSELTRLAKAVGAQPLETWQLALQEVPR